VAGRSSAQVACRAIETLTGTVPYVRHTDAATMYAHLVAAAARQRRAGPAGMRRVRGRGHEEAEPST